MADQLELEAEGSISAIIRCLESQRDLFDLNTETWFRGQPNYEKHRLVPKIFRHDKDDGSKFFYDEAGMYAEFIRRYPEHSTSHRNIFEWLTLMQHYGLPTRLLDWTTNLLVALYFCCKEESSSDGALYAFNLKSTLTTDDEYSEFLRLLISSRNTADFYERLVDIACRKFDDRSSINGIPLKEWKADFTHLNDVINDTSGDGASKFLSFLE